MTNQKKKRTTGYFAADLAAAVALMFCPPVVHGAEVAQWKVFETSYESAKAYPNAFTEVEVDVVFKQGEKQWKVPAFWTGGDTWKVRFAPPAPGKYSYHVECTDQANPDLNGKEKTLSVAAYNGDNPLLKHGFVQANPGKSYFAHADGTPFLWLGDTWWKCLCKRMTWEGFQELTADRKAKGFSVVQIVCGPYPDEDFFAPSWENEGGQPYLAKDMSVISPKYFEYNWDGPEVKDLEPDVDWHVYYFDPASGRKFDQGTIKATATAGDAAAKPVSFRKNVPSPQDWVLVFEREKH
jgi:hypothetical protein